MENNLLAITDVDKNLNDKCQFQIQVNHIWQTVKAVDFFDYLYHIGRIDGHDPGKETAWLEYEDGYWDYGRQDWNEGGRYRTRSYEDFLDEFQNDDQLFIEFIQAGQIAEERKEAKAA